MLDVHRAVLVMLLAMLLAWPLVPPRTAYSQEPGSSALRILGTLEMPDGVELIRGDPILGIDPERGHLYLSHFVEDQWHVAVYDLHADADAPPLLRSVPVGPETESPRSVSPNTVTYARDRQTIFALSSVHGPVNAADPVRTVRVTDLSDLDRAAENSQTWLLADQGLAGFVPQGVTYSADDGRVYLIGEFAGQNQLSAFTKGNVATTPVSAPVAVVALDADTGTVAWVRLLPRCSRVLTFSRFGGMVARSSLDNSLYLGCMPGGVIQVQTPGQPVLVRLHVAPDADQVDAAGFDIEYLPVPGDYSPGEGAATHDPRTDRVFINSLSDQTPGAFVYDGERSAWVGHIAADGSRFTKLAMDEESGRFYLAEFFGGRIIVTDGAATPPPQSPPETVMAPGGDMVEVKFEIRPDPGSDRIFYVAGSADEEYNDRVVVVEDTTPIIEALPPPDFDAATTDVAEGPDTFVNYTAVSSGFGALGRLVGGAGNVGSYGLIGSSGDVDPFATLRNFGVQAEEPVVVSQGDRTVVAAEVPSVQLAAFGATGKAQALTVDDGTSAEAGAPANLAEGAGAPSETTEPAAQSPYRRVVCSDNGFDEDVTAQSDSDDIDTDDLEGTGAGTGHARVLCDRAGQQTTATSTWRAGPSADDAPGPAVADASFTTLASRDPEAGGAATQTVAVASGLEIPVPEVGMLHIGQVRATATTQAAGRPGTTAASWTRTISGLVVTSADGTQVFPRDDGAGSCATVITVQGGTDGEREEVGSCDLLIDQLNQLLQPQVRVTLPTPDLQVTPQGAYAQVREGIGDFRNGATMLGDSSHAVPALQVVAANDGTEKSRLLLHLAAIDTSTTYQIQPCPFCSVDGGTDPDPAPPPTTEQPSPTPASTETSQPTVETAAAPPPVSLPVQQPEGQSIDLAAAQPPTSEPEVAPQQALSLPGRIGAGLQLLTRDPVQALLVGGVWLLFTGALTTLLRRTRLRQLVSS